MHHVNPKQVGHQPSRHFHIVNPQTNKPSAFKSSNYNSANAYSLSAHMHEQKMSEYNALASSEIFRHHNPSYPSTATANSSFFASFFGTFFSLFTAESNDLSQLDLHGQYVNEAIQMVKDHLERCRREGVQRTTVITGRGAHSVGGIAKIKPKVEELLAGMEVRYRKDGPGAFVVECGRQDGGGIVGWIFNPNIIIMSLIIILLF